MAELTTQTIAAVQTRAQNRVLKKFLANKSAVMGAVVVGFFVLVALLAPWIAPFDPVKANFLAVRKAPSAMYGLGPMNWAAIFCPALSGGRERR